MDHEDKLPEEPDNGRTRRGLDKLINWTAVISAAILLAQIVEARLYNFDRKNGVDVGGTAAFERALWIMLTASLACVLAFSVRGAFPRTRWDRKMTKACCLMTGYTAVYLLCLNSGAIIPSYFSQLAYFFCVANAHLQLQAASSAYHCRFDVCVYVLISGIIFLLPAFFAPGGRISQPYDASDICKHGADACFKVGGGGAQSAIDYWTLGVEYYDTREHWQAGAVGTAFWYLHLVSLYGYRAVILWARWRTLSDLKRRMDSAEVRSFISVKTVANALQLSQLALPVVTSVAADHGYHYPASINFTLQYLLSPLVILSCVDVTQEEEQKILTRAADLRKEQMKAEAVASARRSFLRFIFHELREYWMDMQPRVPGRKIAFIISHTGGYRTYSTLFTTFPHCPKHMCFMTMQAFHSRHWRWAWRTCAIASPRMARHCTVTYIAGTLW